MKQNQKQIGWIAGLACAVLLIVLLLTMCSGNGDHQGEIPVPSQAPAETTAATEAAPEPTEESAEATEETTEAAEETTEATEETTEPTTGGNSTPGGTSGYNPGGSNNNDDDDDTGSTTEKAPAAGSKESPYVETVAQLPDSFFSVTVPAEGSVYQLVYGVRDGVLTVEVMGTNTFSSTEEKAIWMLEGVDLAITGNGTWNITCPNCTLYSEGGLITVDGPTVNVTATTGYGVHINDYAKKNILTVKGTSVLNVTSGNCGVYTKGVISEVIVQDTAKINVSAGKEAFYLAAQAAVTSEYPASSAALRISGKASVDITCTAGRYNVGNGFSAGFFIGVQNVENGIAVTCAKIVYLDSSVHIVKLVERADVADSKVDNVEIVAHARAVVSVVIVAVDVQVFPSANCNLCNIRHEVVGNALRILADLAGFMSADRVEITKQNDVPLVIGGVKVGKHLLYHTLRPAVWVRTLALGEKLGYLGSFGNAVDSC